MPTLNWLTRDQDLQTSSRVPYRLLEEVPDLGYGDPATGNMLIQGDNLEALKALLPFYAGQVKCIFIDPPYNTRSAFEHYDDNLEHAQWLGMMYPRLELLRELLREDGSIWVTIDDNEGHYLKVVMDEVFGRGNFIANVVWQKRTSPDARIPLGAAHDHILVYAKELERVNLRKLPLTAAQVALYKNIDRDERGVWTSTDFTAQGWRPNQMYKIVSPSGKTFEPPPGRCWANVEAEYQCLRKDNRLWFGAQGDARPRVKNFLFEKGRVSSWSWWQNDDVGHNQESKREGNVLFGADAAFTTPKPERLLERVLTIATDAEQTVLDSFLGSGTTAAVAQKMNRRYIGIELGEHAVTHCVPRLKRVIDGEQGGISKAVNWQGGGGFRFYRLGKSVFDEEGKITGGIRFEDLAAHIWFSETRTPHGKQPGGPGRSPLLGLHDGTAYFLLYNGILGDKRPRGGNVLTRAVFDELRMLLPEGFAGPWVVYGESARLADATLKALAITFKQTPYDVRAR